jgi:hypothetical protein
MVRFFFVFFAVDEKRCFCVCGDGIGVGYEIG